MSIYVWVWSAVRLFWCQLAAGGTAGLLGLPGDAVHALEVASQTAAIGPGGVEILVVIVLLKFLQINRLKLLIKLHTSQIKN